MFTKRTACQATQNCRQLILTADKEWSHRQCGNIHKTLLRPLLLTDCCSLFSAIMRIRPMSQGKCAKLLMNQLRDLQTLIDMSSVDNS